MPASTGEATLLYGIVTIFPALPPKALKIFGMLYLELIVLEQILNTQSKKA